MLRGEVFDVAVDIREGSKTFGKWFGIVLSAEKKNMLYIPEGFAHGFLVLSDVPSFPISCRIFTILRMKAVYYGTMHDWEYNGRLLKICR